MSVTDVQKIILPELLEMYQRPYGATGDEHAIKAYRDALQDVPGAALKLGWDEIKKYHTAPRRPNSGEILEVCRKFYKKRKEDEKAPSQHECFNTAQGQYALEKGHGSNFYASCYQNKKILDMFETKKLIARNERSMEEGLNDRDWRMREQTQRIQNDTKEKEKALRDKFLRNREGAA